MLLYQTMEPSLTFIQSLGWHGLKSRLVSDISFSECRNLYFVTFSARLVNWELIPIAYNSVVMYSLYPLVHGFLLA